MARNYAQEYRRRIERGIASGFTRSEARGHPGVRDVGVKRSETFGAALGKAESITTSVVEPSGRPQDRKYRVTVIDSKGRARDFTFDIRAKDRVKAIIGEQAFRGAPITGS